MSGYGSTLRIAVERLVDAAGSAYGGTLRLAGSLRQGYRSATIHVARGTEDLILKVHARMPSQASVDAVLEARRHGLPVPVPVERRDGGLVGDVAGHTCSLLPRVEGEAPEPGRTDQLESAGRMLASVHAIPGDAVSARTKVETLAASCVSRLDAAGLDRHVSPRRLERLSVSSDRIVLLHGDYRGQNLLFSGDAVAGILDWDEAAGGDPLLDLAYALVFFKAVLSPDAPTVEEMAALARGYASAASLPETAALSDHLLLALTRGLLIWSEIRGGTSGEAADRAAAWIDAYAPLFDQTDAIAERLTR